MTFGDAYPRCEMIGQTLTILISRTCSYSSVCRFNRREEDFDTLLDYNNYLNEVEGLERPTLENICQWAAQKLKDRFPGLRSVRVSRPSIGEACVYDLS